uniref:HMG box domain-containing protein n=1 Tax=viral metagenome TaxID=1070528 RepID=A0A6C0E2K6_9ZZZZ
MFIENINKFVLEFLQLNKNNENIDEVWVSKKNQQLLLKTLKKNNVKIKDPAKPKRGKSAFLFFCEENRKKIKKKYPEYSVKEIVSKLGTDWKVLKDSNSEEINRYEQMSIKDRNRYKNEMKTYIPILNRKIDVKKSTKKPSKRRSKRTQEEIMFDNFLKNKKTRAKKSHPELDSKDIVQYIKSKWEKLPDEKKKKYNIKK